MPNKINEQELVIEHQHKLLVTQSSIIFDYIVTDISLKQTLSLLETRICLFTLYYILTLLLSDNCGKKDDNNKIEKASLTADRQKK